MSKNGLIDQQSEQYRRGQILGFTMAEIMLVLLFLLLLLLGTKLTKLTNKLNEEEKTNAVKTVVYGKVQDKLTELKNNHTIAQDKDSLWLTEKLVLAAEDIVKHQSSWSEDIQEKLKKLDSNNTYLTNENHNLKDELKKLNAKSTQLANENHSLKEALENATQQASNSEKLENIIKKRKISHGEAEVCLLNCGGGPKACWGESLSNPDFIYNIALFDNGYFVSPDMNSVAKNKADWMSLPNMARIETPVFLSPSDFMKHFAKLKRHAVENDCVFQVRFVDYDTSDKPTYKLRKEIVDRYAYTTRFKNWSYGEVFSK